MKRALLVLAIVSPLTFHLSPLRAQWWTGWSPKTSLALCLHQTDSTFELYSPLQTADPIPVSKWSLRNDTLRLECASIGLKMTLARQDSLWRGTWRQGILRETIVFHPADTLFQLRRPQTPQPPYDFDEETIAVDYVDSHGDSIHLEGTLSVPRDGASRQKHPCLMLVSGSGQQNRDEELFLHRPFLVLANYLASHGIATFRYDDRGVGASRCCSPSQGELSEGLRGTCLDSATTHTLAEDAEALFNTLKTNPHVDPARLGIGGHSEGAAIAPLIAARNQDVKFVAMLAGQGCTGHDIMVLQNKALFLSRGVSPRLCALRAACMRDLFALPTTASVKDYQAVILRHTDNLTPAEIDSIELKKGMAYTLKQQITLPWMQAFLRLDPASYLPKVKCPLLALGGDRDCQVPSSPNLQRIKQLCPKAQTHELKGLNHLFQHCTTGSPDEYVQIEETFAPEAMRLILDFILGPDLNSGNAGIDIR